MLDYNNGMLYFIMEGNSNKNIHADEMKFMKICSEMIIMKGRILKWIS